MNNIKIMSTYFNIFRIKVKSNPFSYWEIQPEYNFTLDFCSNELFYRLKNLGTNMYLCANNQNVNIYYIQIKLTNDYSD